MTTRDILVTMSRSALRAWASRWFLLGFQMSGRGFHGELYDPIKYPRVRTLLLAEFRRVWDAEHPPIGSKKK